MTFSVFWGAAAIVLSGVFGVLGLTTNYKSKDTGKITRWGVIALAGVLVTSCGGLAAYILSEQAKAESSRVAGERLKKIGDLTRELNERTVSIETQAASFRDRSLKSFAGSKARLYFDLSCSKPENKTLCIKALTKRTFTDSMFSGIEFSVWSSSKNFSSQGQDPPMNVQLSFVIPATPTLTGYADDLNAGSNFRGIISFSIDADVIVNNANGGATSIDELKGSYLDIESCAVPALSHPLKIHEIDITSASGMTAGFSLDDSYDAMQDDDPSCQIYEGYVENVDYLN